MISVPVETTNPTVPNRLKTFCMGKKQKSPGGVTGLFSRVRRPPRGCSSYSLKGPVQPKLGSDGEFVAGNAAEFSVDTDVVVDFDGATKFASDFQLLIST